jgi:hypothetical protein
MENMECVQNFGEEAFANMSSLKTGKITLRWTLQRQGVRMELACDRVQRPILVLAVLNF